MTQLVLLGGVAVGLAVLAPSKIGGGWIGSPAVVWIALAVLVSMVAGIFAAQTWELRVRRRARGRRHQPRHAFANSAAFTRDDNHRCSLTGCITAHE